MRRALHNRIAILMAAALACAFMAGLFHLLVMRFDAGNVYPKYSSLRPDPLGTMALLESIADVEGMTATHNLAPMGMFQPAQEATVFYLGLSGNGLNSMSREDARMLSDMAMGGARIVIALSPSYARGTGWVERMLNETGKQNPDEQQKCADGSEKSWSKTGGIGNGISNDTAYAEPSPWSGWPFYDTFRLHMGVMNTGDINNDGDDAPVALLAGGLGGLPHALKWHSAAYIDHADESWEPRYLLEGRPVAAERRLGRGSVAVITDSYYLTNEALMSDRETQLIAWLIGGGRNVVFEETHLGLIENPGVASLGRKYGLEWLALALVVLALIFVWQNASSLVPQGGQSAAQAGLMSGKDYASGMVSLMRRNVPPGELVRTCVEQWARSLQGAKKHRAQQGIDALLLESGSANPVDTYRRIDKILNERKR